MCLLGTEEIDGVPSRVVAILHPDLPAWFRIWVGVDDGLVRRELMLAEGHLMDHRFGLQRPRRPTAAAVGDCPQR